MTEYFLGLIIFAFVGSVIFSLVPSGIGKRYVRLLCGLCSIGCIAFPLLKLVGGEVELDGISAIFEPISTIDCNTVEIYKDSINNATIEIAEQSLKNDIIREASAKSDDIDVIISIGENSDKFYIDTVSVIIYPSGYHLNPDKIDAVCRDKLDKGAEFIYK